MFDKLIDLLVQSIKLFRVFIVIHEFEVGVVLRLGRFHRAVGPGVCWVIPFDVDEIYYAPTMVQTMRIGPQSLTARGSPIPSPLGVLVEGTLPRAEGPAVVVGALVTWQVKDPIKFVLVIQGGEQVIEDTAYGVIAKVVMDSTWEELTSLDINRELTAKMRARAEIYGVYIKSAQITDLTKARSLRLLTSATVHQGQSAHLG